MKMIITLAALVSATALAKNIENNPDGNLTVKTCRATVSLNGEEIKLDKCRVSKLPKSSKNGKSVTTRKTQE